MRSIACVAPVVLLSGSIVAAAQQSAASQITNPVPPDVKSVTAGRQLFQKYCRPCHGPDAKGDGPMAPKDVHPPNLTDAEWAHGAADGEIFTSIRDGIGPKFDMQSMKSRMTTTEIWHLVNYLRSLATPASR